MFEAEFWVAAAFAIFVGLLIYLRVHKMIVDNIDERSARIKSDLDAARILKEEAQALLAEYKRKQQEVTVNRLIYQSYNIKNYIEQL